LAGEVTMQSLIGLSLPLMLFAVWPDAASAQEKFKASVSDDKILAEFRFASNKFSLTANELDNLIAKLSRVRSEMDPSVPLEPPIRNSIEAIRDPAWYAPPAESTPGSAVLILRHPGFGWIAFGMPKQTAFEMGYYLAAQSHQIKDRRPDKR
jgi:hypothetical protein